MGQPVVHFEVIGKDGEGLARFYTAMFGWEIDTNNPVGYGLVDRESNLNADGVGVGGGIMGMPDGNGGHVTFYVEVPDVEAALQQAVELGGERVMGPAEVPGGPTLGQFRDVEGHLIGLTQSA